MRVRPPVTASAKATARIPGASTLCTPDRSSCQPRASGSGDASMRQAAGRLRHGGDHQEGSHAEHDAERGQDPAADGHRRFDLAGHRRGFGSGEAEEADAGGLDERERRQSAGERQYADTDGHGHGDRRVPRGEPVQHALQQEPLAHEAAQDRQGRHAQSPDQEDGPGDRHPTQQSAECVQIPRAGGLLDRAGSQEEAALEHGVEDHVEEGGDQGQEGERAVPGRGEQPRGTHPQQDEAHVVGRRVGEEPFEIARRGRVQGTEECGQRAHGHDSQPPPRGTTVEHAVPDAEDAVDPEIHHGRRHQSRHGAGRLGVGPGKPHVQRYGAGLGREAEDDQHEGRAAHPWAQVRCRRPDGGERLTTRPGGQQHQSDQDCSRPGLGHHRIPLPSHLHLRPVLVIGQDEEQRGQGHRLPEEEEGRHVGGRGDQQERGHEERQGARSGATGESVPLVSETIDQGADTHDGGDGDEQCSEPVEAQRESGEGKQAVRVESARPHRWRGRGPPPRRRRCTRPL